MNHAALFIEMMKVYRFDDHHINSLREGVTALQIMGSDVKDCTWYWFHIDYGTWGIGQRLKLGCL